MDSSNGNYSTLGDILKDAKRFIQYLFRKWFILLLAVILGFGAGLLLYNIQKPKYEAECTFILEEKQGGLGGLSGLASQFGLDIGGLMGGGGGMFSGDNILAILSSKIILQKVLLSKVDSSSNQKELADLYLDFSGLKKKWTKHPELAAIRFDSVSEMSELNILQDSVLNIIFENVVEKHLVIERVSKKGTILSVNVISENPDFSKKLVQRLVNRSKELYLSVKTSISTANISRLERKADSLLALLNRKTYGVAQAQVIDPNPALKILQVPTEMITRDKTVLATLYSEVVKNLEVAKTSLMLQTPVIEVLDVPSRSIYDNKRGKLFFIIISVFVLTLFFTILLFLRFKNQKQ